MAPRAHRSTQTVDPTYQVAVQAWIASGHPARLPPEITCTVFGFTLSDIQILTARRLLTPLGNPAQNAPKLDAAVEIFRLAIDREWLHAATKEVSKHWQQKRRRARGQHCKPAGDLAQGNPAGEKSLSGQTSKRVAPENDFPTLKHQEDLP